jgi:CHAT domain-containing protein
MRDWVHGTSRLSCTPVPFNLRCMGTVRLLTIMRMRVATFLLWALAIALLPLSACLPAPKAIPPAPRNDTTTSVSTAQPEKQTAHSDHTSQTGAQSGEPSENPKRTLRSHTIRTIDGGRHGYVSRPYVREAAPDGTSRVHPQSAIVTSLGSGVPVATLSASEQAIADKLAQERAAVDADPNARKIPPHPTVVSLAVADAEGDTSREDTHPDVIEAYPAIEAPDTVSAGQEIAVQVSFSNELLDLKTKIITGSNDNGKVNVKMQGQGQIRLIVNVTAPGLDFTRGTNTQAITLTRDGNSTVAAFYMRPHLGPNGELPDLRDTRILATILHDQAFIARIARPIMITANSAQRAEVRRSTDSGSTAAHAPSSSNAAQRGTIAQPNLEVELPAALTGLNAVAPTITIIENRVGKMLRLVFILPYQMPVTRDIADADALHQWINSKFDLMAHRGRGFANVQPSSTEDQSATDVLNAFGSELYDRVAPPEFTEELFHHPANEISIQVLSDDPSIPWELMRPIDPLIEKRTDFLGTLVPVARWPLMQSRAQSPNARPPQNMHLVESVVVAPQYAGSLNLASAGSEREMLVHTPTFVPIDGTYTAVRYLATNPPRGFIHFAGHGAVRVKGGVPQFAILLNDGEMAPDTWASLQGRAAAPGTIYFFNACEVGETTQFMNDVDGWAPALLSNGASGYIGALWDISDSTANRFASVFYKSLIDSLGQSKAVRVARVLTETRRQVFEETKDPTALAYVFYGDPDLSIER